MKTFMASPDQRLRRKWYVVDATDCTLGRMASEVAKVLRGKNKPMFTPHVDTGDYVIIINAEKLTVYRQKAGSEDLLQTFRVCRRNEGDHAKRDAGQEAGAELLSWQLRVCFPRDPWEELC